MTKFIKKLWIQKNEKKILLNDVKFELYKEFLNTKYRNVKLSSYISGNNFSNYKFSFTTTPYWNASYKNNISVVLRRFDYFQTKMVDYRKYAHTFNYPGNFTLRTRNVSLLHHFYLKKNLQALTAVTDMEAQFQYQHTQAKENERLWFKKKNATLKVQDFNVISEQKFNPFFKKKTPRQKLIFLRKKRNWIKKNLLQYWNRYFGYTSQQNRKIYFQLILFRIFKKQYNFFSKKVKFQIKKQLIKKKKIVDDRRSRQLKKKNQISKVNFNLTSFISWIFFLNKKRSLKKKIKPKFIFLDTHFKKFLTQFSFVSNFFYFFKKWKKEIKREQVLKKQQFYPWSFFTLLITGNISPKISFKKRLNIISNYIRLTPLCTKTYNKKKIKFSHPLISFYFKFLWLLFTFKKKYFNLRLQHFKRFSFLIKTLNIFLKKNTKLCIKKYKRYLYKKKDQIANFFGEYDNVYLFMVKKMRLVKSKTKSLRQQHKQLTRLKRFVHSRPKPFRPILNNLQTILQQIVKLKRSAKFKRNIIHTICKYTSLLEFHQMVTLFSPFKFFSKNMLYSIWLNESYLFFKKYKRKKGRPLLNSIVLIRPVLRKIKDLGMPFLAFFKKNPLLQTNKVLPLNLHKLFLNSLKNYFIPLKSFSQQNISFLPSVTKRLPFVQNSLQPIKIIFSPYKQRKRSLQVNILNFKNHNLFSSWPGLVIRKISAIVGVHQAHKFTFLINMKPKKAKKNFMAKSLTIRHASNYLYKYLRQVGGSFEVIVRTTTAVSSRMEDSYVNLLMGFIYKGFQNKKQFLKKTFVKKKTLIPYKLRTLKHSYLKKFLINNVSKTRLIKLKQKQNKKKQNKIKNKRIVKTMLQRMDLLKKIKQLRYKNQTKVLIKKPKSFFKEQKLKKSKKKVYKRKSYSLKYLLIFFKYLILTRKIMVVLLSKLLLISNKRQFDIFSKSFLTLVNYQAIFRFFIKSMFVSFFLKRFIRKLKLCKNNLQTKQRSFRPFYSLLKKLRYKYFRTIKKVYFTQYTVYTKTTHGYPTKKRKNRRL